MARDFIDISAGKEFLDWEQIKELIRAAGGGSIYPVPYDSDDVFPENDNDLCRLIVGNPHGLNRCIAIHRLQLNEVRESLRPTLFRCHAGFWNIAIPLHFNNIFLGAVMGCGILDHTRKEIDYQTLANEIHIDFKVLSEALRKVPLLTKSKIKAFQSMLSHLLQNIILSKLSGDESDRKKLKNYERVFLQYNALYKISKIMRANPTFDVLQARLTETVKNESGSTVVFMYLINEQNQLLLTVNTRGFEDLSGKYLLDDTVLQETLKLYEHSKASGFPLPTTITRGEKPVTIEKMDNFASRLLLPLISNNVLIGCLDLYSKEAGTFNEWDRQFSSFFRILSSQVANALEIALLRHKTEILSLTDEMTGLPNFRYFSQKISEEITRCARYGHILSLIMIDLDKFKDFNDTFGHPAGDSALRNLAEIMKTSIRDVDVAARYGGEEFAIILPETGPKEAQLIIDRIRERVYGYDFIPNDHVNFRKLTISAGIASFPNDAREKQILIERADQALYYSKTHGRNRITHFGDTAAYENTEILKQVDHQGAI